MTNLTGAVWRKSSRSGQSNNCVEVATNLTDNGVVGLRDSKNPNGPAFAMDPQTWVTFLHGVKAGAFDL